MKGLIVIKSLIYCFFLVACIVSAGCSGIGSHEGKEEDFEPGRIYEAGVVHVIDGDTILVQFTGGDQEKVRFLGIDCPETDVQANSPGEYPGIDDASHLASWGKRASEFTADTIEGRDVLLEFDSLAGTRDPYDRMLAYVTLQDGTDLGALLVSKGMARVYTDEDFSREPDYLELESAARGGKVGLWGSESGPFGITVPVPIDTPSQGVFIASVNYDAAGDDRENLNDEYVVIANAGPDTEDLSGWTLSGPTQVPFTFGPVMLETGGQVILYTGNGTPSGTDLFRNLSSPALGNRGGTLVLLDQEGGEISSFYWGSDASG